MPLFPPLPSGERSGCLCMESPMLRLATIIQLFLFGTGRYNGYVEALYNLFQNLSEMRSNRVKGVDFVDGAKEEKIRSS